MDTIHWIEYMIYNAMFALQSRLWTKSIGSIDPIERVLDHLRSNREQHGYFRTKFFFIKLKNFFKP